MSFYMQKAAKTYNLVIKKYAKISVCKRFMICK